MSESTSEKSKKPKSYVDDFEDLMIFNEFLHV